MFRRWLATESLSSCELRYNERVFLMAAAETLSRKAQKRSTRNLLRGAKSCGVQSFILLTTIHDSVHITVFARISW